MEQTRAGNKQVSSSRCSVLLSTTCYALAFPSLIVSIWYNTGLRHHPGGEKTRNETVLFALEVISELISLKSYIQHYVTELALHTTSGVCDLGTQPRALNRRPLEKSRQRFGSSQAFATTYLSTYQTQSGDKPSTDTTTGIWVLEVEGSSGYCLVHASSWCL